MNHIVALSGGKDSTAMALRLAEVEPRDYTYVCTPTGDELPDMLAHWERCERLLGKPIVRVGEISLVQLTKQQRMLPNWQARFCTRILKIEPYLAWAIKRLPATLYVGLRADEEGRAGIELPNVFAEKTTQRYPLRDWGWGISEVLDFLANRKIEIPRRTDCARCFYQTLYEWYRLWKDHPTIYQSAVDDEHWTNHTYRSPQRDTQPTSLAGLRAKFETGYTPKERKRGEGCRVCSM